MNDSKIIAIVGATGAQGGGLASAILADPAIEKARVDATELQCAILRH